MGNGVVGKWFVVNATEIDYENEVEVFRADMFTLPGAYLEFKNDGQGTTYDGEADADTFAYTVTKGNLVLKYTGEDDVTTYHIKELTGSALCVQEEYIEAYDGTVHKELIEINLHKQLT